MKGFKHTGRGPVYGKHTAPPKGPVGKAMCFAEGGSVGHALVQRSQPITDEDKAGGGKTPLRQGFKKGGFIADATKNKGALHRALGVPESQKIPAKKLAKAEHSSSPLMRKRANLAKTLKSFNHKAEGGRVGNVSAALKAVQSMVNRGIPAEKAAAVAASQHGVDRAAISSEMAKKGVTPNPALLSKGGSARRSYGSFNRTPRC